MMPLDHRMVWVLACCCMASFLASLSLRCSVHLTARTILDDSHKCCSPGFSSWISWPLSRVDIVSVWPVVLLFGLYIPTVSGRTPESG